MTAGRGIVRGESMQAKGKVPLLQLWLTLPRASAGQTRDSRSFASIQYPSAARMVSRFVSTAAPRAAISRGLAITSR
jgi:redox-sensitive bicupin YhaK (pirin superfamily)